MCSHFIEVRNTAKMLSLRRQKKVFDSLEQFIVVKTEISSSCMAGFRLALGQSSEPHCRSLLRWRLRCSTPITD
jgi:hypothetical protein